jgi:hypothetical protein
MATEQLERFGFTPIFPHTHDREELETNSGVPMGVRVTGAPQAAPERSTRMSSESSDTLRAMIRLIAPARALKEDLERSVHLEMCEGTGDMAVRSFEGLRATVARLSDEPYIEALRLDTPEGATDAQKVALTMLAVGQLTAYLEGQTGLAGLSGGGGDRNISIQRAPNINIGHISKNHPAVLDKIVELVGTKENPEEEEAGDE